MSIPHINAIVRPMTFIFSLSIIKESRLIMTNFSKAILTGETFGFPSYLGTFFVTFLCLNSMKYYLTTTSPIRCQRQKCSDCFIETEAIFIGDFS